MDFHNNRSLGRGVALFLGLAAPMPALLALVVGLTSPRFFGAGALWLLAGLAVVCSGYGAAMGWWLGQTIERPLRRWRGVSETMLEKGGWVGDLPFVDDKSLLGDLARHGRIARDKIAELSKAAAASAEAQRASSEQERLRVEEKETRDRGRATVLAALGEALSQLAEGNLAHRVTAEFPGPVQALKDNFNLAMDRLCEAMEGLGGRAESICAGTDEISRAANELSRRTERQAAALEETAAALQQVTQTVRRTADGASGAKIVALAATTEARNSEKVVADAVEAMSEIERSAQQIAQIIGVIDEIAFQTNLLALNAGVEAARAGEAGRGFAVVASEVRALAQRSADAAKEIKVLISTSTHQVTGGVQLVGETGNALQRILTKVSEINGVVLDIAGSAESQALGLHEINNSIKEMDQVTQQNAAMAQQSTAACLGLADEARQLGVAIDRFDLGASAPAPVATAPPDAVEEPLHRLSPALALRRRAQRAFGGGAAPEADWEEF